MAAIAGVGSNFITRLEAHKPGRTEKVADVFNALSTVLHEKTRKVIEHDKCVTVTSKFGGNTEITED